MTSKSDTDAGAAAQREAFRRDVLNGLRAKPKTLPSKWLYDAAGSAIYDEITQLPEYYPTRTEAAILKQSAGDIAEMVGPGAALVEYGPGATTKTGILLGAMDSPAAYVPVDVSQTFLDQICEMVGRDFPNLKTAPLLADFMQPVVANEAELGSARRVGFFPGSTIGNLSDQHIAKFLKNARDTLGDDGLLVIGYDLAKDPATLVAAYDDAAGVTARFNLNLLSRINRELGGEFDPSAFSHRAVWNDDASRIEMHLVSIRDQSVAIGGQVIEFEAGETIHTENSRKFTVASVGALFEAAGWTSIKTFTDAKSLFAVSLLKASS